MGMKLAETRETAQAIHESRLSQHSFVGVPIHNTQNSLDCQNCYTEASDINSRKSEAAGSTLFSDASWLNDISLGTQQQHRQSTQHQQFEKKITKQPQPGSSPLQRQDLKEEPSNGLFVYCYIDERGQESGDQGPILFNLFVLTGGSENDRILDVI